MSSLLHLAQTTTGRRVVGWIFTMSLTIPIQRLCETKTLLAFHHPQPSYSFHVVLVPKKAICHLKELDPTDFTFLFLVDLFSAVKSIVEEFGLCGNGYRLIVNGVKFQNFLQLHFSSF